MSRLLWLALAMQLGTGRALLGASAWLAVGVLLLSRVLLTLLSGSKRTAKFAPWLDGLLLVSSSWLSFSGWRPG